ncbi:hypothetical protein KQH26_00715 [bacterium]|nr:hypothetical protein [bacterium]
MKKTIRFLTSLLFTVYLLTAFTDIHANTSNPLLTEYLQLSEEATETLPTAAKSEVSVNTDETYNYACSPKLEESTVYDFIDE